MLPLRRLNRFFATFFGVGNIKLAPGTVAALGAAFAYLLFPVLSHPMVVATVFVGGIISCELEGRRTGIKDDSSLVIDEIAGMWFTFTYLRNPSFILVVLGFFLFRLFDIWKPAFIKSSQKLPGGTGVMIDDILAAVPSNLILRFIMTI